MGLDIVSVIKATLKIQSILIGLHSTNYLKLISQPVQLNSTIVIKNNDDDVV